jgi:uncharacterized protein YaiL (DUF2058 family)
MSGLFGKALGEQLVQAGVATEKQLEKAKEKPSKAGYKKKTGGKRKGKGQRGQKAADPAKQKIEVSETAVTRQVSKKDKVNAIIRKQLVVAGDGQSFNFVLAGKLKQLEVSAEQAAQLASGELTIVKSEVRRDPYVLVPKEAAAEIAALLPSRVLLSNSDEPEQDSGTE